MPLLDFLGPALPPPPEFPEGKVVARRHLGWDKLPSDIQPLVDSIDELEQRHERGELTRAWQNQCIMSLSRSQTTTQRILIVVLGFWVVTNGPIVLNVLRSWFGVQGS